jgi:hypothetical protein
MKRKNAYFLHKLILFVKPLLVMMLELGLGMRNWKLKMKRILKLKNLQLFFVGAVD